MARAALRLAFLTICLVPSISLGGVLPLTHGQYVETTVACVKASHASSFRIVESGFAFPATITETEVMTRRGDTVGVKVSFYQIEDGAPLSETSWVLVVHDDEHVEIVDGASRRAYRWCAHS